MERRRELRLRLALQVRVWGTDHNGKSFEQDATTVDLTPRGVRLRRGICHPIEPRFDSSDTAQGQPSEVLREMGWGIPIEGPHRAGIARRGED